MPTQSETTPTKGYVLLFLGLILVSTAGPFIKQAGMHPFTLVWLRLALSAPAFFVLALRRGGSLWPREHLPTMVLGSALLTTHFLLWVGAFQLTDYASNLVLLVAQPVVAGMVSLRMGERSRASVLLPTGLACVGLLVIAGGDFALGPRALLGDLCCVLAGAAITFFYVSTKAPRKALSTELFMAWTLGMGALWTLPVVLLAKAPLWPATALQWRWIAALVCCTTLGGHGLMNAAAQYVSLFVLNLVIVLEPAIGIALGSVWFDPGLRVDTLVGSVFLAAAVVVGLRPVASVPPLKPEL